MNNADLAERLNAEVGLTGGDAVSPNIIRQWVAWKVLSKATASGRMIGRGPSWSRSANATRQAFRLAELRKLGVKRETALIVQAYIEWGHPDFERVRGALLHEVKKWQSQLARHRTTYIGDAHYRNLSAVQKRAIRTQLGPLDSRFEGTQFKQSDEFYATFAQLAESGDGDTGRLHELLAAAFETILPGVGPMLSGVPSVGFTDLVAGAFGSPEEISNSAQSEIESASEREFRIARAITRRTLRAPSQFKRLTAIQGTSNHLSELLEMQIDLSPQISVGPWAVFQFVQYLLYVRRDHKCAEIEVNGDNFAELSQILFPGFAIPKT